MIVQLIGRLGRGGAQRVACVLAAGIAETGARSAAVALLAGGDAEAEGAAPAEIHCLGAERGNPATVLRAAARLRRMIVREGVRAVHVHGRDCLPVAVLATRGLGSRRPVLAFTWHDSTSVLGGGRAALALARASLARCDLIYGSSASVAERLGARAGLDTVSSFRNGVPIRPETTGLTADPPLIVWLGRLVPEKDPEAFLEAIGALHASGRRVRAVLGGESPSRDGRYRGELEARAASMGLADVIRLPGWIDDPDAILRDAAITVQTSRSEGLSMALLEQMMNGLAIVATDVGDTGEVIQPEETGLLVPAEDPAALVAALERVVDDVALRERLGSTARAIAVEELSTVAMARRALEAYDAAAGRRSAATSEGVAAT
ncbi:MAG: glycosyltransferase family 4 protein [Phycisphaerales bacterium]